MTILGYGGNICFPSAVDITRYNIIQYIQSLGGSTTPGCGANGVFDGNWTYCGQAPCPPAILPSLALIDVRTNQGSSPSDSTFSLSNPGCGASNYTIADDAAWLSVDPSTGSCSSESDVITVSYSTASLSAGIHRATITVTSPDAINSPQLVDVRLVVYSQSFNNIWYVNTSASGSASGMNWTDAFTSLQGALEVVKEDHEIWVAAGTYKPAGPGGSRCATFQLANGTEVYGGFAGAETERTQSNPAANLTILSGDLNSNDGPSFANNGENSYHVVTASGTDGTTILDGFKIMAGNANDGASYNCGGGIYVDTGSPVIRNCSLVSNNTSGWGGGAYIKNATPVLTACIFESNAAASGGGLACFTGAKPVISGCTFVENSSTNSGGAMYSGSTTSPTVVNCQFLGNTATDTGGALELGSSATDKEPQWIGCIFVRNATTNSGFADGAGGVFVNTVSGAQARRFVNCTFVGNTCANPYSPGGIRSNSPNLVALDNCILWNNGGETKDHQYQYGGTGGSISVALCDIQGDTATLNLAPSFVRSPGTGDDYGNLHLQDSSPCIDAGDNALVPDDIIDLDSDGNATEKVPFDLDGNPRIVAELCASLEPKVNMGAYEGADVDHNKIADACELIDCDVDQQNDRSEGFVQPRYDWDDDCDVDQVDFARWQYCFGRQEPQQSLWDEYLCVELDSNDDQMINMDDWDAFEAATTGPGISYNPPAPSPPGSSLPFEITAWRSVRAHGAVGELSIELAWVEDAELATIELRQGSQQTVKVDLSRAAGALSNLSFTTIIDGEFNFITPADIHFENDNQTVVMTFVDDPGTPNDFLLDQACYFIDMWEALEDPDGGTLEGVSYTAIRMLTGDVDGDALVEQVDDVDAIAAANGQTAGASNLRLDLNVDGTIDTTDSGIAAGLLGNTVSCSEGMMGMGMAFVEGISVISGADALVGTSVSASLVLHDGGAASVTLPPTGGTISVDLVITSDTPIWGFDGKLAVDAANVVSINAADWTELDNVLFSNGVEGHDLASYYDLTVMDWMWVRFTQDGSDVTDSGTDVETLLQPDPPLTSPEDVKGPPTAWTLTYSLAEVNGPINTPDGQWFTTTTNIGGATRELLPPGHTKLATLSLTVSGAPGTCHLTLTNGLFTDEAFQSVPMSPAAALEIVVAGP